MVNEVYSRKLKSLKNQYDSAARGRNLEQKKEATGKIDDKEFFRAYVKRCLTVKPEFRNNSSKKYKTAF